MAIKWFQTFAMIMALAAAVSLGLGVANFISTYYLLFEPDYDPYCGSSLNGCIYSSAVIFSFILPGGWGSLMVFITAIIAIKAYGNMQKWRTVFMTLSFVTAIIFIPAMIILCVVNAAFVATSPGDGYGAPFNLSNPESTNTTTVLFALPVTIAGLGVIEFLHCAGLLLYIIRKKPESKTTTNEIEVTKTVKTTTAVTPSYAPTTPAPLPLPTPLPPPPPPPAAYSPYGRLPYRPPANYYRPAMRSAYSRTPALYGGIYNSGYAGRYTPGRPYPTSYVPRGYY